MLKNMGRSAQMLLLLSTCILGGGCAARKAALAPPPDQYQGIVANDTNRLQESLFKGDQEVLPNADIERILSTRALPWMIGIGWQCLGSVLVSCGLRSWLISMYKTLSVYCRLLARLPSLLKFS